MKPSTGRLLGGVCEPSPETEMGPLRLLVEITKFVESKTEKWPNLRS